MLVNNPNESVLNGSNHLPANGTQPEPTNLPTVSTFFFFFLRLFFSKKKKARCFAPVEQKLATNILSSICYVLRQSQFQNERNSCICLNCFFFLFFKKIIFGGHFVGLLCLLTEKKLNLKKKGRDSGLQYIQEAFYQFSQLLVPFQQNGELRELKFFKRVVTGIVTTFFLKIIFAYTCYAFLEFESGIDGKKCLESLDGKDLYGNIIHVGPGWVKFFFFFFEIDKTRLITSIIQIKSQQNKN
ncbi:hypothetical protein RFI_15738 [Reticulomyxa filosa]|uniref:Uncharacterized protein n=1 Tax=Reticulomyxa filosa TaxID=46433 RepID=X6N5C0_RETFI|nr:hypothetical protein RFI_15738 [Reticulomyxa filosa]|eukprot:ETO21465.1 hypothetical protein RFI_15738 [Reticulomyxa filosa]